MAKLTLNELREEIRLILSEYGAPSGKLRRPGRGTGNKTQFKIGYTRDENRELSPTEANVIFKGAVDIWCEVGGEICPELSNDPFVVRKRSAFFQIGDKLTVALERDPRVELATYNPVTQDWYEV